MIKSITRVGDEKFESEQFTFDQYKRTQPGNFKPREEKEKFASLPDVSKPEGLAGRVVPPSVAERWEPNADLQKAAEEDLRRRAVK